MFISSLIKGEFKRHIFPCQLLVYGREYIHLRGRDGNVVTHIPVLLLMVHAHAYLVFQVGLLTFI